MTKVSVIISTFNRSERLEKAIQSVLNQSYQDFEIVIVDDCSTDSTRTVVGKFKDERINYIRMESNFGCDTKPKNEGIKAAKGEYIAFLDDDCEYRKDHLQALVKSLEADTSVAMVYGDRWIVDETGSGAGGLGISLDFTPMALLQRNYIDTSDVLVRKEVLYAVGGFDERYKKYVDWNLWLRMEKAGYKFKRVPLILTDYHLHKDMKSLQQKDEKGFSQPAWDGHDVEIVLPHLGEVKEPRVAIFSLTYDRLEYTKACFESMYKTAGYPYDHYIVDNGSKDGTKEWLEEKNYSCIFNEENKGISIASNQALDIIKKDAEFFESYDIIIKVDNDCMFLTDGWLGKMVEIWKSNHLLGLSPFVQGLKDNPGGAQRLGYGQIKGELVGNTMHLGGICIFADAKAYEDFRWDESGFLHGVQDLEFSQHMMKKGYGLCYMENYFVEHYKGTEQQHKDFPDYFERRKKEKTTKYDKSKS